MDAIISECKLKEEQNICVVSQYLFQNTNFAMKKPLEITEYTLDFYLHLSFPCIQTNLNIFPIEWWEYL